MALFLAMLILWGFLAYGFTGRATAMINHDLALAWLRHLIRNIWGEGSIPDRFIRCPWCVSVWVALPATWALWWLASSYAVIPVGPWWLFCPGVWFTLSWAVSLTADNLDGEE